MKKTSTDQVGNQGNLSPKQIKHWRRVLAMQVGAYAFIMPESEIQRYRDKIQEQVDKLDT